MSGTDVTTDAARAYPDAAGAASRLPTPAVQRWLLFVWFAVLLMVAIGGITRLTGVGPVDRGVEAGRQAPCRRCTSATGASCSSKYKASPQYRFANNWMALADFKRIFFWEYVHRLWGRLIGLFVLRAVRCISSRASALPRRARSQTLGLFALGGLQGALGWYMVQSGLVHEPRVSHFRLAAHLLLAFATGAFVLWLALDAARRATRHADAARCT